MDKQRKSLASVLILVIAISWLVLLMVKPACAQTISPPSVPSFTVQVIDEKGTVPTTYSLNSSSGQIVATIGYNYEETDVYVVIDNQPLALEYPIANQSNDYQGFYYDIQYRGPNSSNPWEERNNINEGYVPTSNEKYTNVTLGDPYGNGTLDVRVQAMIGRIYQATYFPYIPASFEGQTSGWSLTQTVTTRYYSKPLSPTPFPSSAPTLAPTQPSVIGSPSTSFLLISNTISLIVIAILLAIIFALLLHVRKQKRLK